VLAVLREPYVNALRRIDFTRPLTEQQLDFLPRVSPEEYVALLLSGSGDDVGRATATAEAVVFMWSVLAPWCKTPAGEWRTFGEALRLAPHREAEAVVRRLGELGFDVKYAPDKPEEEAWSWHPPHVL
jgi:hypothetical protein